MVAIISIFPTPQIQYSLEFTCTVCILAIREPCELPVGSPNAILASVQLYGRCVGRSSILCVSNWVLKYSTGLHRVRWNGYWHTSSIMSVCIHVVHSEARYESRSAQRQAEAREGLEAESAQTRGSKRGPERLGRCGPERPGICRALFLSRPRPLARVAAGCPIRGICLLPPTSLSLTFDVLALCTRGCSLGSGLLARPVASSALSSSRFGSA